MVHAAATPANRSRKWSITTASSWLQRYPQVYFRNYRRSGPARGNSQNNVVDAVKIYQHLFFRYNYEGAAFRNSRGPLGYFDQLFASADVMNWLSEIIASPDVGTYAFDTEEQRVSPDQHGSERRGR